VHSALFDAHRQTRINGCFIIFTDNSNTVDIFNTLRALPPYNHLLKTAVDILNLGDHDLRVLHVPGVDNEVADALSRAKFHHALDLTPGLKISLGLGHQTLLANVLSLLNPLEVRWGQRFYEPWEPEGQTAYPGYLV
jgi:hypothetical protein